MAIQYIDYKPLSEDELLRIAQTRVEPGYEEQMAIYQQQTDKSANRYQEQLDKLDPAYERAIGSLSSQYEQKRQTVSDAATARGFGRSSYTTDMLAKTHDQQNSDIAEMYHKKEEEAAAIGRQIDDLYDHLLTNQARLTSAKQNQILSQIDSLRNEQTVRELEVRKYNSDLAMREMQLDLQREQLAAQQANWAQQAAISQASAQTGGAYRQQQLAFQMEQFEYKKEQDALAALQEQRRIEAELEAVRLAAAAKTSSSSSKSSSSGSSSKSNASSSSSSSNTSNNSVFNGFKFRTI